MKNLDSVNQYIANLAMLNIKTHNFHFNIVGAGFKIFMNTWKVFITPILIITMPWRNWLKCRDRCRPYLSRIILK